MSNNIYKLENMIMTSWQLKKKRAEQKNLNINIKRINATASPEIPQNVQKQNVQLVDQCVVTSGVQLFHGANQLHFAVAAEVPPVALQQVWRWLFRGLKGWLTDKVQFLTFGGCSLKYLPPTLSAFSFICFCWKSVVI